MWCLISLSNSINLDIDVDPKAKGQECLDQVCSRLGIIEEDYFGLQYRCPRGEVLWLNMRNPIRQQVPGPLPYRLHLRVKFFIPPHLILQETTRHQFYLHVKSDLADGRFAPANAELASLLGYIAQAEWGDFQTSKPACSHQQDNNPNNQSSPTCDNSADHSCYVTFLSGCQQKDTLFWEAVSEAHKKLKGWNQTKAEYWLLKEASSLKGYGEEVFLAKLVNGDGVLLGVGPEGVNIYNVDTKELLQSVSYHCITRATNIGKCLFLTFLADGTEGLSQRREFKLEGTKSANSIYRAITEKHAFYSCETVRHSVTTQFIRDLKGTIVSLFNENTALGKNYVFDVRLTCREVYDNARRALYQADHRKANTECGEGQERRHRWRRRTSMSCTDEEELDDEEDSRMALDVNSEDEDGMCQRTTCKYIQERLTSFEDAMLCRICMDADINTAFFPCRHVACCNPCALKCDRCPLCRSAIECSQFIYLPCLHSKQSLSEQTIG